jgi:G protein-coupled receptor 107
MRACLPHSICCTQISLLITALIQPSVCRSLRQLVMFKHFYIMVLCYIYFTRIVVFILHATLPFQYIWLSSFAEEVATLAFYTLTAMQFRPHEGQGYFQLLSDDDVEMSAL